MFTQHPPTSDRVIYLISCLTLSRSVCTIESAVHTTSHHVFLMSITAVRASIRSFRCQRCRTLNRATTVHRLSSSIVSARPRVPISQRGSMAIRPSSVIILTGNASLRECAKQHTHAESRRLCSNLKEVSIAITHRQNAPDLQHYPSLIPSNRLILLLRGQYLQISMSHHGAGIIPPIPLMRVQQYLPLQPAHSRTQCQRKTSGANITTAIADTQQQHVRSSSSRRPSQRAFPAFPIAGYDRNLSEL